MTTRLLADAVVVLHVLFVAFVVLGGLLVAWRRFFLWIHLPAAVWGFLIEVWGWICPLTTLENALRRRAGEGGYSGGFVEHYLIPILYPEGLTRGLQGFLAGFVVISNVLIYAWVWRRLRRGSARR